MNLIIPYNYIKHKRMSLIHSLVGDFSWKGMSIVALDRRIPKNFFFQCNDCQTDESSNQVLFNKSLINSLYYKIYQYFSKSGITFKVLVMESKIYTMMNDNWLIWGVWGVWGGGELRRLLLLSLLIIVEPLLRRYLWTNHNYIIKEAMAIEKKIAKLVTATAAAPLAHLSMHL